MAERVHFWSPDPNTAFDAVARQKVGEKWPRATLERLNPKYFRGDAGDIPNTPEGDDLVGAMVPSSRPDLVEFYRGNDVEVMIVPFAPGNRPPAPPPPPPPPSGDDGGDDGGGSEDPPVASGVDIATVKEMLGKSVTAIGELVESIDSVDFLQAMKKLEADGKNRKGALEAIEARIGAL